MSHYQEQKPSILFIVPSDYGSLVGKGVIHLILERDEGGFFEKVITVHPHASKTQSLKLNEIHQLMEFGPHYPFPFLNFKFGRAFNHFLKPIFIIKAMIGLVKREHIDIARATDPYGCGFYAWAISRLTGVPFCVSIHADYEKVYQLAGREEGVPLLYRIFETFVLPRAEMVMPIRNYLVPKVLDKGVDPSKVRVIPHGVRVDQFQHIEVEDVYQMFGIPAKKRLVSFVGRLSRENYVDDMIDLAKGLSKNRDDFVLLLVGDGPERERLETLVKEYNLSSVVYFTGFQPFERVVSIRRHSFLALCLMGGFSLIEACVSGCPIISYNVGWHGELVKNGETGFLVEEGNLEALIEAGIFLLDHPEEARLMGEKSKRLAISRHDISRTSEIKRQCYRELVETGKGLGRFRNEDMEQKQKTPVLEIMKDNPWYTSEQLAASQGHQRRTVERRFRFIVQNIEGYFKLNSQKPVRLLDAGCGDGVQLQMLTQIQEMEVWGVDNNPLRASRAKRNFPITHIVCGDLLQLPFLPASFDIILCSQVVEHIPQDELLLKKLANLLKPNGLLILGTPNEGCLMARLRNRVLERNILKTTDHIHFYTESVIRQKVEEAGFEIQTMMRENWFFPLQRMNHYFGTRDWGFQLMAWLNHLIPSQTAGYYFQCVKRMDEK